MSDIDIVLAEERESGAEAGTSELKTLLEVKDKYYELLYAVGIKYENESRHETALRYIRQAEISTDGSAQTSND